MNAYWARTEFNYRFHEEYERTVQKSPVTYRARRPSAVAANWVRNASDLDGQESPGCAATPPRDSSILAGLCR